MDLIALRDISKSESDKEGSFHYTNHIFLFLRAFEAPISFTFSLIPESCVVVRRDHTSQGIPYQVDVNGLNGAKSGVKKRAAFYSRLVCEQALIFSAAGIVSGSYLPEVWH